MLRKKAICWRVMGSIRPAKCIDITRTYLTDFNKNIFFCEDILNCTGPCIVYLLCYVNLGENEWIRQTENDWFFHRSMPLRSCTIFWTYHSIFLSSRTSPCIFRRLFPRPFAQPVASKSTRETTIRFALQSASHLKIHPFPSLTSELSCSRMFSVFFSRISQNADTWRFKVYCTH